MPHAAGRQLDRRVMTNFDARLRFGNVVPAARSRISELELAAASQVARDTSSRRRTAVRRLHWLDPTRRLP
jgi:hypothetical protein